MDPDPDEKILYENLKCPLCKVTFGKSFLLSCQHAICQGCLRDLRSRGRTASVKCPVCGRVCPLSRDEVKESESCDLTYDHVSRGAGNFVESDKTSATPEYMTLEKPYQSLKLRKNDDADGQTNWSIPLFTDSCSIHTQEKKELYCVDCSMCICVRCVLTHLNHNMKNRQDFIKETQQSVGDLVQRCNSKKDNTEANLKAISKVQKEGQLMIACLETDIDEAFDSKFKLLKENKTFLQAHVKLLQSDFNEQIEEMRAQQRQMLEDINSSISLLEMEQVADLDQNSLSTHMLTYSQIDALVEEIFCEPRLKGIGDSIQNLKFSPADDSTLALGKIDQGNYFMNEQRSTSQDPAKISARSRRHCILQKDRPSSILEEDCSLVVSRISELPCQAFGMAVASQDVVVIGYGGARHGIESFAFLDGVVQHLYSELLGAVADITFLKDGKLVASHDSSTLRVYNTDGSPTGTRFRSQTPSKYILAVCRDGDDKIYTANGSSHINVFHPHKGTLEKQITVDSTYSPTQVCVATTGVLITSSCDLSPSSVRVYSREGHVGGSIEASGKNEYLYAAIDDQNKLYLARVTLGSNKVCIESYILKGICLIKHVAFDDLKLKEDVRPESSWCHLACPAPGLLAFACYKTLYFLKVPSYTDMRDDSK